MGSLLGGAAAVLLDLRRRRKKIPRAARAMTTIPPTTPPAMALELEELELLWRGAAAELDEEEVSDAPAATTVTCVVASPWKSGICQYVHWVIYIM